jgi:hypothetical protein
MTNPTNDLIDIYDISDNLILLETEESTEFLDWCSLEGSERINELSRQLRSFLNFKCETIRMRFSKSSRSESYRKEPVNTLNPIRKWERDLTSLFSQFTNLSKKIGIVDGNIAEMIMKLIENVKNKSLEINNKHLIEIRNLSKKIWVVLHNLSELEIHRHPRLLNVVIQIASLLCSSESLFFSPFSDFYLELKVNYLQLEGELSNLIQTGDEELKKKKKIMVKITE